MSALPVGCWSKHFFEIMFIKIIIYFRFKTESNNEYRSSGFRAAWTAVKIPGIIVVGNKEYGELCFF